jgi:hypothetical protein
MIITVQTPPVQSKFNNEWACTFSTFREFNGKSVLMSTATSAALWGDEEAAKAAGARALEVLKKTGQFPNLCEPW